MTSALVLYLYAYAQFPQGSSSPCLLPSRPPAIKPLVYRAIGGHRRQCVWRRLLASLSAGEGATTREGVIREKWMDAWRIILPNGVKRSMRGASTTYYSKYLLLLFNPSRTRSSQRQRPEQKSVVSVWTPHRPTSSDLYLPTYRRMSGQTSPDHGADDVKVYSIKIPKGLRNILNDLTREVTARRACNNGTL